MLFLSCLGRSQVALTAPKTPPRRPKRLPRAPQEAPRARQEGPRRPQEEPKRPQEPVKRAQDPPRSPQKARKEHYPKDDCADQCCRYRRDRQRQNTSYLKGSKQGTGGRRCSPLGEAIRRPPRRGEDHGVSDHRVAGAEVAQVAKILTIVVCILLQIFFG